jgi:ribosome biogenesis GTPase
MSHQDHQPTPADFGWSSHFQAQLTGNEPETATPVRVVAVHKNGFDVAGPGFSGRVPLLNADADDPEGKATTGDWLLVDRETHVPLRLLARRSLFRRKAAGAPQRMQLIAANVDTLFLVTSCDQDFSVARLERYLALAREAGVMPVVVLTKADLADGGPFVAAAAKLMPGLLVEAVDARSAVEVTRALGGWCGRGQTVALVGSSGVGKSTLVNTLLGGVELATAAIRENDGTGKHTTTRRSLHRLPAGGWLLDTPGMRELQLADAGDGIAGVFADVVEIARRCRFNDCRHGGEPGCAIEAAINEGRLDPDRVTRFMKLAREDARNSEAVWRRRARERGFGRLARRTMKEKKGRWRQ